MFLGTFLLFSGVFLLCKYVFRFAGQTLTSSSLTLLTVSRKDEDQPYTLTVNCENTIFGSVLLNELLHSLVT